MKKLILFLILVLIATVEAQECQKGQIPYNGECVWCVESNCNGEDCDQKCKCPEASTCLANEPCYCSACDNSKCVEQVCCCDDVDCTRNCVLMKAERCGSLGGHTCPDLSCHPWRTRIFQIVEPVTENVVPWTVQGVNFVSSGLDYVYRIASSAADFVDQRISPILNPVFRVLLGRGIATEPNFLLPFFFFLMIGLVVYDILYTTSPLSQWVCYVVGVGMAVISIQLKLVNGMISLITHFGALFVTIFGFLLILSSFTFTGIGDLLKKRREEMELEKKRIEREARLAKIEEFVEAIGR